MSRDSAAIADRREFVDNLFFESDESFEDIVAPDLSNAKDAYRYTRYTDSQSARRNWGREQEKGTRDYVKGLRKKDFVILFANEDNEVPYGVPFTCAWGPRANSEPANQDRVDEIASFIVHATGKVFHRLLRTLRDRGIDQTHLRRALELLYVASDPVPQSPDYLRNAIRLDRRGQTDSALDVIYDAFDVLFREGQMEHVDRTLEEVDAASLSDSLLVGVLTATVPAKSHLPARESFYEEAERLLTERGSMEPGLLAGLEP